MRISIGGDISVTDGCRNAITEGKTYELFNDIGSVYKTCERNIVNLECAVTDKDTPIKKFGPNLRAPLELIGVLKEVGVTDCSLSNNHIFDFGIPGLDDTIAELEKNGITYTGIGTDKIDARKNLVIEGDKKIAVISVCEHEFSYALDDRCGAREYDPYDTIDDIVEAKKNSDYVVVIYHGGKEYCRYPSPRLMKLCRSMVHHGADVVLCQHSHCVGCYEEYKGAHILYGQGNFHFIYPANVPRKTDMWNNGLLLVFDFADKCTIEFIPIISEVKGIRLANEAEKEKILSAMEERNLTLSDGSWKEHWREFCLENIDTYSEFVKEEMADKFAHYLDCEAHTDVWRELYKTWHLTER